MNAIFQRLRLKIGGQLVAVLLFVGIAATATVGYLGYSLSREAMLLDQFNKLTAVREMKAQQIEDYLLIIRNQALTLARNRMTVDAVLEFKRAFRDLGRQKIAGDRDGRIREFYASEFLPRLAANLKTQPSLEQYWPGDESTRVAQYHYLANNRFPVGSKHQLDDAGDGSAYSKTHNKYHPIFRDFLEKFGYYDIFLVDPESGHIVYSIFKEVDFGTSLVDGPYRNTNFARAFAIARDSRQQEFAILQDFEPYHPSYNAPAAFIAAPVFDNGQTVGVLLMQMPIDKINRIMTSQQRWADVGLGASGESYIVGDDHLMRSQSRFLLENPEGFFAALRQQKASAELLQQIEATKSTVGLLPIRTEAATAAIDGKTGVGVVSDYRGEAVLSAYRPLQIPDVNWGLLSEIDEAEAHKPIIAMRERMLLFAAVLLIVVAVVALRLAGVLANPIKQLADAAKQIGAGNLAIDVPVSAGNDEIAELGRSFAQMSAGLRAIVRELQTGVQQLSASASEIAATSRESAAVAAEQASSVAEVSTTSEEINRTSMAAAANAEEVASASDTAAEKGRQGIQAVDAAVASMDLIQERVSAVAGKILQLSENTTQIGDIVDVVNDLAEQSNLLAVNASIEAAKAGEQGRGFAVVATEVRNLAEQSKKAAQQIRRILTEIQRETQSTVMATEESNKRVADGQLSVQEVRAMVSELSDVLEKSADMARQISAATAQQAAGVRQITEAMGTLATASRDNAAGAKQLEDASNGINQLSQQLKTSASRYSV